MDFHPVEANLRESFRVLAEGRGLADVLELPGLTIASLGVTFQMFNAAFFNGYIESREALAKQLATANQLFERRGFPWSLWVCEDWLEKSVRRSLSRTCADLGLRLASDLPGMVARGLAPARPTARDFEIVEVDSSAHMTDFRFVGSTCFRVPPVWFSEVFGDEVWRLGKFRSFVGYRNGEAVATSALVLSDGVAGIYNVAVLPRHRGRGFAEAMTRQAVQAAGSEAKEIILQATSLGFRMYQKMGFRDVTRILVYVS